MSRGPNREPDSPLRGAFTAPASMGIPPPMNPPGAPCMPPRPPRGAAAEASRTFADAVAIGEAAAPHDGGTESPPMEPARPRPPNADPATPGDPTRLAPTAPISGRVVTALTGTAAAADIADVIAEDAVMAAFTPGTMVNMEPDAV